ncbi:MAG: hypothetical protein WBG43_12875 [Marinifilaceae bacterium]
MNKRFLLLVMAASLIFACNSAPKKTINSKTTKLAKVTKVDPFTVCDIFEKASENIDKEIVFVGKVKHVCQHSGQRCFVEDTKGNSIKIEATGALKGFNKEIMGMNIKVKGILKEKRISEEEINKMAAAQKAETEGAHCGTESDNILKMRAWMKANSKDYFAFYYVDGSEYEILN